MTYTPWIPLPDLPERQLDKIKQALWKLDESIVYRITAEEVAFQYALDSLAVKVIPELAEGRFPEFLIKETSFLRKPKSFVKS